MQADPKVVLSQHTNSSIYGYILEPGDELMPTDKYDSTSGRWELCPCPGSTLREGTTTTWVRPA